MIIIIVRNSINDDKKFNERLMPKIRNPINDDDSKRNNSNMLYVIMKLEVHK